jgi:hypothetical protein
VLSFVRPTGVVKCRQVLTGFTILTKFACRSRKSHLHSDVGLDGLLTILPGRLFEPISTIVGQSTETRVGELVDLVEGRELSRWGEGGRRIGRVQAARRS